jgi:predicted DCC family thiol-disulfide oxidoreductase YuxK
VATAAYWIDSAGGLHRGALAISEALRAAGGAWGMIGWLSSRPPLSWLARGVYSVVARNRHRLPGSTPACRLPDR